MEQSDLEKKSPDKKDENKGEDFEWASRTQHILYFLFYLMDFGGLGLHIHESSQLSIDGFHYFLFIITTVLLGYPMIFLQNFIGQYTRNGCLFLGEMMPAFSGLGYSMILISFYKFTEQMFYTAMLVYYLLVSISNGSPPPWMKCFRNYYPEFPDCFSGKDIDMCPTKRQSGEPCFPPGTRTLSAYIFKEVIAFSKVPEEHLGPHWLLSSKLFKIILHFFNHLIIYIFLMLAPSMKFSTFYAALRMTASFTLTALMSIFVVVITKPQALFGFTLVIKHLKESFTNLKLIWPNYFVNMIGMLRLAEGGHILFGSFIPESNPQFWMAAILTSAFLIVNLAASVYFFLFLGLLYFDLNMELKFLEIKQENVVFITFPTILGNQASAAFFCVSFFLVLSLMSFLSLVIKLMVLEKSVTVHFNIPDYFLYIKFGFVTLALILSCLFALPEAAEKLSEIKYLFQFYSLISATLQTVIVLLYGLQRIYDDVQYVMGKTVNSYIKLGWIVMPILSCLAFYKTYKTSTFPQKNQILRISIISLMSAPFIFFFIYKMFLFTKQRNFIGILKPTDLYGPPDIEKRILRILHNPRLEVKYNRRVETCNHDCLLDSNAVQVAIEEEIILLDNLIKDLTHSKKEMEEEIISQVNQHKNYLKKALEEKKKKKNTNVYM